MKRKVLSFLCAFLLTLAVPTTAQAVDDPPGVCWQYTVERSISADRLPEPEANYCLQLRRGVVGYLRLGKPHGALDHFAAAYKAAGEFPPGEQRARAQDEARVAYALALEATGRVSDALTLIQQKNEAQRDVVALARGAMLARHLPVDKSGPALDAFQVARTALPNHWTDKVEATANALAARKAGKDAPFPSGIAHFYLPSYLPDRPLAGMESKCGCTNEGTAPLSFHAANATRDMADYIIALQPRLGHNLHGQWVLIGHADASCKLGRQAQCRADNLELSRQRAEQARQKLLTALAARGVPNLPVIIEYHGMEQPLDPQETDRSWKPNRRLQLVWRDKNVVEATASCPWRLSLFRPGAADGPGSNGQPVDAGEAMAPDIALPSRCCRRSGQQRPAG